MKNKLAKLKYLPNKFEIIEPGDHVICAVSKQKIYLQNLNYWNVDLQEAYFSYKEAQLKREEKNKLAKLKYLPNKFEIIEPGDHVICAVSKQKIYLKNLNYWNVELQEAYFSYKEAQFKREEKNK